MASAGDGKLTVTLGDAIHMPFRPYLVCLFSTGTRRPVVDELAWVVNHLQDLAPLRPKVLSYKSMFCECKSSYSCCCENINIHAHKQKHAHLLLSINPIGLLISGKFFAVSGETFNHLVVFTLATCRPSCAFSLLLLLLLLCVHVRSRKGAGGVHS